MRYRLWNVQGNLEISFIGIDHLVFEHRRLFSGFPVDNVFHFEMTCHVNCFPFFLDSICHENDTRS